jgi:phospholipid-transporting ATPase
MYYPQTYHHIQEIQKYNIQDYRPRYVTPPKTLFAPFPSPYPPTSTNYVIGWNNSKKPSAKYVKCNECASSADMPSRKQTRVKRGFCRHMIQQEKEEDMERWRVRGRRVLSVLLAHTKMGMERSALTGWMYYVMTWVRLYFCA